MYETSACGPQAFSPTHGSTMLHSLVYIKLCMKHINQSKFIEQNLLVEPYKIEPII